MGTIYILLAALIFGSNPSLQNFLLQSGMTPDFVAFGTVVASGLFGLIAALLRRESLKLTAKQFLCVFTAGVIGRGVTEICLVQAYTLVPAGVATMIHFLFPTVVCIVSAVFFREKLTFFKLVAIILSVCGLSGIAAGQTAGSIYGILLAGITSFSFAFYYLMSERSPLRELPPMTMLFYMHLFALLPCAAQLAGMEKQALPEAPWQYVLLLVSGFMCFTAFLLLNKGIPLAGATTAAFVNMLEPVTSVVLSVVIFHSRLTLSTVVGCALITCAVFINNLKLEFGMKKGICL